MQPTQNLAALLQIFKLQLHAMLLTILWFHLTTLSYHCWTVWLKNYRNRVKRLQLIVKHKHSQQWTFIPQQSSQKRMTDSNERVCSTTVWRMRRNEKETFAKCNNQQVSTAMQCYPIKSSPLLIQSTHLNIITHLHHITASIPFVSWL